MASVVPVKEKQLMDVKLGELPSCILMRGFTPKGIAGAFQRGYYRYYNKYVNVKKGGIAGISKVLAAHAFFNYCRCYKELKHKWLRQVPLKRAQCGGTFGIPDHDLCLAPLNPFIF